MNIKEYWSNLPPESKRKVILFSTVASLIVIAWGLVSLMDTGNGKKKSTADKRPISREILTNRDPKNLGIDGLKAELDFLKKQMRTMQQNQSPTSNPEDGGDANLFEQYPDMPGLNDEDRAALERIRSAASNGAPVNYSPPPANSGVELVPPIRNQNTAPEGNSGAYVEQEQNDSLPSESAVTQPVRKLEIKTIGAEKGSTDGTKKASKAENQDGEVETVSGGRSKGNSRFVLPAGSILEGVMLTGLDAPTASKAKQQPFPTLIRVKHEAMLPNRWRTDVRECFIVASGYGDLASERAYLRAEALSCVKDDGTIMESTIDAYASGEDGKNGIRGRLVSKQGSMIAQALMGGFIQGVSNMYQPARVPQLSLDPSAGALQRPDASLAVQEGVASGVKEAGKAIADFYIDMARNTFPIIEVDAGRKVTFVVTRSANISTKQAAENKGTPPINSMLSLTPAGRAVQMGNMAYESGLLNQPQN